MDYKYDKKTLSLLGLKGRDAHLARLLQSCSFLDVHLAVVAHSVWKQEGDPDDQANQNFEITDWIDSHGNHIDLTNLKVEFKSQIIGDFSKLLNLIGAPDEEDENPDEDNEKILIINRKYYHFLLVVWPKHQTTDIYLRYNFFAYLLQLERRVSMISGKLQLSGFPISRLAAIEDLRKILDFCANSPRHVWNPTKESRNWNNGIKTVKRSRTTLRLLKLCSRLKAKNEGLAVLANLLAKEEWICDNRVVAALAEFQCNVAGIAFSGLFLFVSLYNNYL